MKKITIFGSMLTLSILLGIGFTILMPQEAKALPPCTPCPPYHVAIGDCTFKCQPGYIGIKEAVYAGYWVLYDPIFGYMSGPCNFQGYYCNCMKDVVPQDDPGPFNP